MPLVYRAETKHPVSGGECLGPFNSHGWPAIQTAIRKFGWDRGYNNQGRFPGSTRDVPQADDNYHIGCKTMHQWRSWFPKPVAKALRDEGYVLRVFDVPEDAIAQGRRQVAFDPAKARLVETLDPLTKLPLAA